MQGGKGEGLFFLFKRITTYQSAVLKKHYLGNTSYWERECLGSYGSALRTVMLVPRMG